MNVKMFCLNLVYNKWITILTLHADYFLSIFSLFLLDMNPKKPERTTNQIKANEQQKSSLVRFRNVE